MEGGQPSSTRSMITIDDIDLDAKATADDFTIPANYIEAPPVILSPGVTSH